MTITAKSTVPFAVSATGTAADDVQFARLVSETERRCPVTQLFRRSGLELDSSWTRADLPVSV